LQEVPQQPQQIIYDNQSVIDKIVNNNEDDSGLVQSFYDVVGDSETCPSSPQDTSRFLSSFNSNSEMVPSDSGIDTLS